MNENVTKKMIADRAADRLGIYKNKTAAIVDVVFEEIAEALANGDKVDVFGFGQFEITERGERKGYNPATKEAIMIPARKAVHFKASKTLKDKLK